MIVVPYEGFSRGDCASESTMPDRTTPLHSMTNGVSSTEETSTAGKENKSIHTNCNSSASQAIIIHERDGPKNFNIFVGDLSPEVENHTLRDAFAPFGEVQDCRVVRDPMTMKSRGYGFVSYVKKTEAESAIQAMNGQWIGNRTIRTNWAARKNKTEVTAPVKPLSYEEVYNQASSTNCTVYMGGISNNFPDEMIQKAFEPYGDIQEIRIFKEKGYAFIRYAHKSSAANAIVHVNNTKMNGFVVKCSWGKETPEVINAVIPQSQQSAATTTAQYPFTYTGQPLGYWYHQSYPTTTAAHIQGQYLQSVQGYPYSQFGYQQGYVGRLGLPLPSTTGSPWAGQAQLPSAVTQTTPLAQPPAAATQAIIPTFPATVQQFQLTEEEWLTPHNILI